MGVQFNLLPDIKIAYLKARRQEHMVVLISTMAIIVSLVIFAILLSVVYGLQKKNLSDLNGDIKVASRELEDTEDLDKILTVQNQLESLPALHDDKVVSSRLYTMLSQITPAEASIAKLNVDYSIDTMTISGSASSLAVVNKFVDTIKFTNYTVGDSDETQRAFSEVVLSSFTRDNDSTTYEITFKFAPIIFDSTEETELTVPQIISTRSEVDKPTALFQEGQ